MRAAAVPRVPFNRPFLVGTEMQYVAEAVAAMHLSGDGDFTRRCQSALEALTGSARALLTTSGTHALELAALLLDVGPGDEVILPSFTFTSTANAFVLRGATPVFCDIRPDTLNLDERRVERLVTPRTRAIVAVHYAGVACEMDALLAIAQPRGIDVVEDNAHGLFGRYRSRPLGSIGRLGALSFHETKNISCGEGGGLLINDPALVARAEILREKGTNRAAFFRGEIDKYTWVDIGSSYLPSDISAAFLWAQLEDADDIQARRRVLWERYATELAAWAADQSVRLPIVPAHCEHPAHIFYVVLPSAEDQGAFIDHLRAQGIGSVFHYMPLHAASGGRRWRRDTSDPCLVTEHVSSRLVRLPLYAELDEELQHRVITAVRQYEVLQAPVPNQ